MTTKQSRDSSDNVKKYQPKTQNIIVFLLTTLAMIFVATTIIPYTVTNDFKYNKTGKSLWPENELQTKTKSYQLTREQLHFFELNGWLQVKNVIPISYMRLLHHEVTQIKTHWWWREAWRLRSSHLARFMSWRTSPTIRQFWFENPIREAISQLLKVNQVRLLNDLIFGNKKGLFGLPWHNDVSSFNIIDPVEKDVTVWFPIWDDQNGLYPELNDTTGGLFGIVGLQDSEKVCTTGPTLQGAAKWFNDPTCLKNLDAIAAIPPMKLGDALLFSRSVAHKTIPFQPQSGVEVRYGVFGRFINANARGNPPIKNTIVLPHASCSPRNHTTTTTTATATDNHIIDSPCHPIIYPEPKPEEYESPVVFDTISQLISQYQVAGMRMILGFFMSLGVQ
jgi:hypothetical protein